MTNAGRFGISRARASKAMVLWNGVWINWEINCGDLSAWDLIEEREGIG